MSDVVEGAAASLAESAGATAVTREAAPQPASSWWWRPRPRSTLPTWSGRCSATQTCSSRSRWRRRSTAWPRPGRWRDPTPIVWSWWAATCASRRATRRCPRTPRRWDVAVALLVDYGWWLPAWRPATDYRSQYSAQRSLGGGIVLDAIHEIDYALALAGPADRRSRRLRHHRRSRHRRRGCRRHHPASSHRRAVAHPPRLPAAGVLAKLHADRQHGADHLGRPPGRGGAGQRGRRGADPAGEVASTPTPTRSTSPRCDTCWRRSTRGRRRATTSSARRRRWRSRWRPAMARPDDDGRRDPGADGIDPVPRQGARRPPGPADAGAHHRALLARGHGGQGRGGHHRGRARTTRWRRWPRHRAPG